MVNIKDWETIGNEFVNGIKEGLENSVKFMTLHVKVLHIYLNSKTLKPTGKGWYALDDVMIEFTYDEIDDIPSQIETVTWMNY